MTPCPERHGWVWLADAWAGETTDRGQVEDWRAAGLPFVVARRDLGDAESVIRLGLALPDKRRIGVTVDRRHVTRTAPPVLLAEALLSAPEAWRPALDRLDRECRALGCPPQLYGSLAWQHISGKLYVRPDSDIDLLFRPSDRTSLDALIARLQAAPAKPRLDGEILFADGSAAAWRELAGEAADIMVKHPSAVSLVARAALLAQLAL